MIGEIFHRKLFGVSFAFWVCLAFIALLNPTFAAPAKKGDPGLGVELELRTVTIKNTEKAQLSAEELEEIKGKEVKPIDEDLKDLKQTNWKITAEYSKAKDIFLEIIIDGEKNGLGDGKTDEIGEEIHAYFVCVLTLFCPFKSIHN